METIRSAGGLAAPERTLDLLVRRAPERTLDLLVRRARARTLDRKFPTYRCRQHPEAPPQACGQLVPIPGGDNLDGQPCPNCSRLTGNPERPSRLVFGHLQRVPVEELEPELFAEPLDGGADAVAD